MPGAEPEAAEHIMAGSGAPRRIVWSVQLCVALVVHFCAGVQAQTGNLFGQNFSGDVRDTVAVEEPKTELRVALPAVLWYVMMIQLIANILH